MKQLKALGIETMEQLIEAANSLQINIGILVGRVDQDENRDGAESYNDCYGDNINRSAS